MVTVPAVWSDAAKNRTLQAVHRAGFNHQYLPLFKRTVTITEPEVAAIYILKSMTGTAQGEWLAIRDGFVVCDLGGGIVDLIPYRVASLHPIVVEEATIGTGAQCGGSFVDRALLQWLEDALGVHDFLSIASCPADEISRTRLLRKLVEMLQEFTLTTKSGFSSTEKYYLYLPAPLSSVDDRLMGMCDGEIRVAP